MVTDTLLIAKKMQIVLFMYRANFLDKRMLAIPDKLYSKKLPNMCLFNGTDSRKGMVMATAMVKQSKKKVLYKNIKNKYDLFYCN
jgi:hypothetical protein